MTTISFLKVLKAIIGVEKYIRIESEAAIFISLKRDRMSFSYIGRRHSEQTISVLNTQIICVQHTKYLCSEQLILFSEQFTLLSEQK